VKKQTKPTPDPNKQAKATEPAFSEEDAWALAGQFFPVPFFPNGYNM
jgi:hypothetical protein